MSGVGMRLRMDSLGFTESSSEGLGDMTPIDLGDPSVKHGRWSHGQTVLEEMLAENSENRDTAVGIPAAADTLAAEHSQVSFESKPPSAFSVIETDAAPLPREGIMETGGRLDPAAAKPSAALMSLVSRVRAVKKPEGDLPKKLPSATGHSPRDRRTDVGLKDEDIPLGSLHSAAAAVPVVPEIGTVVDDAHMDEDAKHEDASGGKAESECVPNAVCWSFLTFKGWLPILPETEQRSLEAHFQRWVVGDRSDPEFIMFKGKKYDRRVKLSTMSTLMGIKVETIEPIPKEPVIFSSEKFHEGCYVESSNIGRFPH